MVTTVMIILVLHIQTIIKGIKNNLVQNVLDRIFLASNLSGNAIFGIPVKLLDNHNRLSLIKTDCEISLIRLT